MTRRPQGRRVRLRVHAHANKHGSRPLSGRARFLPAAGKIVALPFDSAEANDSPSAEGGLVAMDAILQRHAASRMPASHSGESQHLDSCRSLGTVSANASSHLEIVESVAKLRATSASGAGEREFAFACAFIEGE